MTAIYMNIDNIPGNVQANEYQNWINLQSIHFGQSRFVDTPVGKPSDRSYGRTQFNDITIAKQLDPATHQLLTHTWCGKVIPEVEIHICHDGDDPTPLSKYTINNVIISNNSHGCSAGTTPSEIIKLNFAKIEFSYLGRDSNNNTLSPMITGYDLSLAQIS